MVYHSEKHIYGVTCTLLSLVCSLEVVEVTHWRPIFYWQICALERFQHCCCCYMLFILQCATVTVILFKHFQRHFCFRIVPFAYAYSLMMLEFMFLEHRSFFSVVRLNNINVNTDHTMPQACRQIWHPITLYTTTTLYCDAPTIVTQLNGFLDSDWLIAALFCVMLTYLSVLPGNWFFTCLFQVSPIILINPFLSHRTDSAQINIYGHFLFIYLLNSCVINGALMHYNNDWLTPHYFFFFLFFYFW